MVLKGKRRIYEGKNVGLVVKEEIEDLAEKLEELQRSYGVKDYEVQNCGNFDKKASILQRRLEKLGGFSSEKCTEQISEQAESNLPIHGSLETDKESFVLGCKHSQASGDVSGVNIFLVFTHSQVCSFLVLMKALLLFTFSLELRKFT